MIYFSVTLEAFDSEHQRGSRALICLKQRRRMPRATILRRVDGDANEQELRVLQELDLGRPDRGAGPLMQVNAIAFEGLML